jgi:hypothetical protein
MQEKTDRLVDSASYAASNATKSAKEVNTKALFLGLFISFKNLLPFLNSSNMHLDLSPF